MRVMTAARSAPDAPKQGDNPAPAEASQQTIQELKRWVVLLERGKAAVA
jgi:hypothetical protein